MKAMNRQSTTRVRLFYSNNVNHFYRNQLNDRRHTIQSSFVSYYISGLDRQHIRYFQFNMDLFRDLLGYLFFSVTHSYSKKHIKRFCDEKN